MAIGHILLDLLTKVLLEDRDLSIRHRWVRVRLQRLQLLNQRLHRAVFRVRHQECEVNQVVRIREVPQMAKEYLERRLRIT